MCVCVCVFISVHIFIAFSVFMTHRFVQLALKKNLEAQYQNTRIIKYDSTSIGKHLVISFHSKIHFLFFRTFFFGQKIITIPFIITTRITRIRRILFNDAPKHLRATYIKGENIFTSTNWPKMSINQWKDQKISASGS